MNPRLEVGQENFLYSFFKALSFNFMIFGWLAKCSFFKAAVGYRLVCSIISIEGIIKFAKDHSSLISQNV